MRIVFLDRSTVGDVPNLDKLGSYGETVFYDTTPAHKTIERVWDAEIIITNKVIIDKNVMDQATGLKLICIAATGMNNIDLEYAVKIGIPVKNASDYSTFSVTQSTFAMLLYLLNHLRYYDDYVRSGAYSAGPIFTHHGREIRELQNSTFGIIGLGAIGRSVAGLARDFGSRVIYYSTSGKNHNSAYERTGLDDLLRESDIISIHAPLNDKTKGLIGYRELQRMKKNCILLNTGRGMIVDERDLARALDENLIGAAGIDVMEQEPIPGNSALLNIKNREKLLITPHIAWGSIESRTLLIEKVCRNIENFIAGS